MPSPEVQVQLSDEQLRRLDERSKRSGHSRSALIGEAIEDYLGSPNSDEIDRQIVVGYERIPQTDYEPW
jgi:metal-responsive CopG/Arc/MetJ family transcriptional regulator